jgi:hypothetical protein
MNGVVRAGVPELAFCNYETPEKFPTNDRSDIRDNLLAPFWADLDLTGGQMYLVLTIFNGKPHTVIEWENVRIKQTNQRVSFQLWFEDGSDNIWFSYPAGFDAAVGRSNPTATIGAEDLGTKGVNYYHYSGSGAQTGALPNGSKDVWVGLESTSAVFTFKANATAAVNSNITNEATATVSSTTNKAWANTRICGNATATQPKVSIQSRQYPLVEWAGSMHDSFELWRSTSPYVGPTAPGSAKVFEGKTMSFIDMDTPGVGNPGVNYFYVLRTKNCAGTSTADSAGVAEFDFALTKGN